MRIAVIGAGGVGGYFGGRLAESGADVTFVVRGATAEALRSRGLVIESIKGNVHLRDVKVAGETPPPAPFDFVLVAVKAWQVAEAAQRIKPLLGPDSLVVPLQNGIDAPDILASILGREHVAGGLSAIVAYAAAPGVIHHIGADPMIAFGELDNQRSGRTGRLLETLKAAGITADIPEDIHRSMWTKFVFITPMSGIGAITRVPVGIWRTMAETRVLAKEAVAEVVAVAGARGISLDPDIHARTMQRYDGLPPESTASLQRDVMAGRPSELDAQLGAVVRLGNESGAVTPLHRFMYHSLLPQERQARDKSP